MLPTNIMKQGVLFQKVKHGETISNRPSQKLKIK
jgi:hypothetical protein